MLVVFNFSSAETQNVFLKSYSGLFSTQRVVTRTANKLDKVSSVSTTLMIACDVYYGLINK